MGKFIPEGDQAFKSMAVAFAQSIAANPSLYMLGPADSNELVRVVDEYVAKLAITNVPGTRTTVTIANKDDARRSAEQIIRVYGNLIRANMGVSAPDKIAIGVRERPTKLSRRACPASSPMLKFVAATPGCHTLRFCDSMTPTSRGKPFGATALQLFVAISDYGSEPIYDPSQARYVGEYGRNPIGVQHEFKDTGRTATYFARWVGARNEHGPWSLPLTVQVMFAGSPRLEASGSTDGEADADGGSLKLAA